MGLARLRRDCVEAKEALSTDVDTLVPVALPGLSTTVRITRAEFELMIRPALTETIAAMHPRPPQRPASNPPQLRSILLVGGSSRIPLVSEMLHREFSVPTALDTHPKHDVALGSVRVGQDETDITTAAPPAPVPPDPRERHGLATAQVAAAAMSAEPPNDPRAARRLGRRAGRRGPRRRRRRPRRHRKPSSPRRRRAHRRAAGDPDAGPARVGDRTPPPAGDASRCRWHHPDPPPETVGAGPRGPAVWSGYWRWFWPRWSWASGPVS